MRTRVRLLSILLAVIVSGPIASAQSHRAASVTIDAASPPPAVGVPVVLRVVVIPPVGEHVFYRVFANGISVPGCASASPTCTWTPEQPGTYLFHAEITLPNSKAPRVIASRVSVVVPAAGTASGGTVTEQPSSNQTPPTLTPTRLRLEADRQSVTAGESIEFRVSTADGQPLPRYVFDLADGSEVQAKGSATFAASYARVGQFRPSVRLADGFDEQDAVTISVVSPPWPWIQVAFGAVALVAGAWVLKRIWPAPAITLHSRPNETWRFAPPGAAAIALDVRYAPNLASLRFTPKPPIDGART